MSNKVSRSTVKAVQLKHDSADEEDGELESPNRRSNMHGIGETAGGSGVPAFLAKLWRLVDDPDTNSLICWSKDGRSFIIHNQAQFARELLPLNYKHNNMASFIRQLNMYGFHKITSIENGGLRFDRDEIEFSHPCFKRNYPYLLDHIKRKISNTKNVDDKSALKQETVSKVLTDVKAMRGRQDNLDSRFSVMKQENEALWREIASLRQKHAKQQQIVNKLIQFLISIVQPSRNMSGVKRHMQLMINDTPENARGRTTSETESENGGPVIHELSEELLDEVMNPHSPAVYGKLTPTAHFDNESVSPLAMERPRSSISTSNYDYSNQSAEDLLAVTNQILAGTVTGAASPLASSTSTMSRSPAQQVPYTVTEVPDAAHAPELPLPSSPYSDEVHVLTTPMVREQEARNRQLLKERNKLRRREADLIDVDSSPKSQRTRSRVMPQPVQVKTEPGNFNNAMLSENNMPSLLEADNTDLYSVNFISDNMPADIFEDASLLSANGGEGGSNSDAAACKLDQQQQFGRSMVSSGKFASTPLNFDGASTSSAAAAAAAANAGNVMSDANLASTSKAMAVAKYTGDNNGHEIRNVDEVSGHLDNMQDELETLKDLLRGDNVSIDHNMLLGVLQSGADLSAASRMSALAPNFKLTEEELLLKLFNDSDLLDNYGLSFPNDSLSSDKKNNSGSELMAYQPSMYDLSDILDTDDSNKNQDTGMGLERQLQTQSSVLNTPRHDM